MLICNPLSLLLSPLKSGLICSTTFFARSSSWKAWCSISASAGRSVSSSFESSMASWSNSSASESFSAKASNRSMISFIVWGRLGGEPLAAWRCTEWWTRWFLFSPGCFCCSLRGEVDAAAGSLRVDLRSAGGDGVAVWLDRFFLLGVSEEGGFSGFDGFATSTRGCASISAAASTSSSEVSTKKHRDSGRWSSSRSVTQAERVWKIALPLSRSRMMHGVSSRLFTRLISAESKCRFVRPDDATLSLRRL
mmetsp:Transcript_19774/g.26839  ORF Transcript_19774/g.26839 Transcript_19774/m.26839 type:complete len:250 (-) Transcript_19774:222-971(-)